MRVDGWATAQALDRVKLAHPLVSWSDLWIFASYLAVEHLGGPQIEFRPGRPDAVSGGRECPPEERIPSVSDPASEPSMAHFP
jgi:hypothetical protein